jgi:histidyl-tRNA synthetase
MTQKPSIPKGTRDFSPAEMVKREFIFDTIKSVFRLCGYQPIETPAMENLSTLLGKYGEEGDKLLFRILNSGDYLNKIPPEILKSLSAIREENTSTDISGFISEKGLRYDLTVPFARFVVQNRNEITFPFKRYQIQPVWRADKPQRGRYREFFQCDVDVIGSDSLMNEVELVMIIDEVFKRLKVNTIIKINNRKILQGIAEYIGETDKFTRITTAIDKLDKTGMDAVKNELLQMGCAPEAVNKLIDILQFEGNNEEKIGFLKDKLASSETGSAGITEVGQVFGWLKNSEIQTEVVFDITLARGLNYYTGAIFEVVARDVKIGSICGGGRYDDLTGIFGLPGVSGVGISFGADRIFDVMSELKLFPDETTSLTKVLLVNFGEKEQIYCLQLLNKLRQAGINSEMYPEPAKMKKQMTYANNKHIPYVLLIGENEMNAGTITVKNMETGEQLSYENLSTFVKML